MEFKFIKLPHNDFNLILKKHMLELEASDASYKDYKDLLFLNNKNALLVFENGSKIGFILFKDTLMSLNITSIYLDPVHRGQGLEEQMINALYNYVKKPYTILVRKDNSYIIDVVKRLNLFTTSQANKKLNELFFVYTKDFYKKIPYTKILINVDALYDNEYKEYMTVKRILKAYGIKPTKYNIVTYTREIEKVTEDYNMGRLTDEEYYNEKYRRYPKSLGVNIDPLLCLRINNSTKVAYKPGIKKFLKSVGRRKHIMVISSIHPDSLKLIKSQLRFPNISKYHEVEEITYETLGKIIKDTRYRNIEEICYITNQAIDTSILGLGIDTFLISKNKIALEEFLFQRCYYSPNELIKDIIKK